MTTRGPYLCLACVHLDWTTGEIWRCAAYPSGIPAVILEGADHRRPRGDEANGLTFEPTQTESAAVVLAAWEAIAK